MTAIVNFAYSIFDLFSRVPEFVTPAQLADALGIQNPDRGTTTRIHRWMHMQGYRMTKRRINGLSVRGYSIPHDPEAETRAKREVFILLEQARKREALAVAAAQDVLSERRRQVISEGWTPAHDDGHVNDEIAAMACFYAMPPGARDWSAKDTGYGDTFGAAIIPNGWDAKEGDRRRELVKAGALVLAEIERLDRAALRAAAAPCGYLCRLDERLGFIPEAGCPVHDKPTAAPTVPDVSTGKGGVA